MNSRPATTVPFGDYSGHPIKVTTTAATTKRRSHSAPNRSARKWEEQQKEKES
jgi:hypothetical protein